MLWQFQPHRIENSSHGEDEQWKHLNKKNKNQSCIKKIQRTNHPQGCYVFRLLVLLGLNILTYFNQKKPRKMIQTKMQGEQFQGIQFGKFYGVIRQTKNLGFTDQQIRPKLFYLEDNTTMLPRSFLNTKQNKLNEMKQIQQIFHGLVGYKQFRFQSNKNTIFYKKTKLKLINYKFPEVDALYKKLFSQVGYNEQLFNLDISLKKLNVTNEQISHLEYYYADKKYGIGNQSIEAPICIFTQSSYFDRQNFERYLASIQNQNYSNYHVVYVSQYMDNLGYYDVIEYLKSHKMSIKSNIKLVKNLQNLGTLANIYFWVNKFCGDDDIVFVLQNTQSIVGRQTLKIINSIYKQPHIWYSQSKYIEIERNQKKEGSSNQRTPHGKNENQLSHIRIFRKKILQSFPLQTLIDYKFEEKSHLVWPRFYIANLNNFQKYMHFDILGVSKIDMKEIFIARLNNTGLKTQKTKFIQTPIRVQYKNYSDNSSKFYKRTVYNEANIGKKYSKSEKLQINLTKYFPQTRDDWKTLRNQSNTNNSEIYILTPTDLNLIKLIMLSIKYYKLIQIISQVMILGHLIFIQVLSFLINFSLSHSHIPDRLLPTSF